MQSTNDLIKEVAKRVKDDHLCYMSIVTREISSFELSTIKSPEVMREIVQLEKYLDRYVKVQPMTTKDLLSEMKDFLEDVSDKSLRKELKLALSHKKPERNFLQVVDSSMELKLHWSIYLSAQYIEFVKEQFIQDYNY